ncbi:MAG TPA: DNA-processing protein DprA [Pseudonocardiaceae bacterium]|jgi:DNA processing protein|nr:DNA-processing protein DprA [Pseudonocardiaceae bacterium]
MSQPEALPSHNVHADAAPSPNAGVPSNVGPNRHAGETPEADRAGPTPQIILADGVVPTGQTVPADGVGPATRIDPGLQAACPQAAIPRAANTCSGISDELLLARAFLLSAAEPPAPALAALVAAVGPIEAAKLVKSGDVPAAVAEETHARRALDRAEADLDEAHTAGARLLVPEDPQWPAWPFAALDLAVNRGVRWAGQPLALWVRGSGNLADLTQRAVALVGARAATDYGERTSTELGHTLCLHGFTIVSGAAYGVDASAHLGALAANGPTVAVLGCGISVAYPAGHANLLRRIADAGAVISEYPPKTPPARHRFLVRNRLIAALSSGLVVVEAGRRSGSRNTAATAAALGRTVLAVPGLVDSANSVGCHELIRGGHAILVSRTEDVIEAVGRLGDDLSEAPVEERRETDGLDERSLRVFEGLSRHSARTAEQVAVTSGVPVDRVRAVLPTLELRGLARQTDVGWQARTAKADAPPAQMPAKPGNGCGDA